MSAKLGMDAHVETGHKRSTFVHDTNTLIHWTLARSLDMEEDERGILLFVTPFPGTLLAKIRGERVSFFIICSHSSNALQHRMFCLQVLRLKHLKAITSLCPSQNHYIFDSAVIQKYSISPLKTADRATNSMGQQVSLTRSVVFEDSGNPDESPIYRHSATFTENGGKLISSFRCSPESLTTCDLLRVASVKYRNCHSLGEREPLANGAFGKYQWITYGEFYSNVMNFARGLARLGLTAGDKVGIYSVNCPWWQTTCYACHSSSLVAVPIYDSLGPGSAEYIINHSECAAVIVSQEKLGSLKSVLSQAPSVRHVLVIGNYERCEDGQVVFDSCQSVLESGKDVDVELVEPNPDDLALIMYTSGSTGKPKGCLLTHRNLIAGATGLGCLGCSITTSDTYFSFLPLAHIYEMGVEIIMVSQGASIGFFSGSVRNLIDDLGALQPTIICGVPRVWNRIAEQMKKKISELPRLKRMLVEATLGLKSRCIHAGRPHSLLLDQLILAPFRNSLGGRVRLIVSGGAPILPEVYEFLITAITPNIVQGYGLTEVAASIAVSEIPQLSPKANGCVSHTSDVKLRKVEGLLYDPRGEVIAGEILVRGPHVFKGYYKDQALTDEVIDKDGWFATGDIGVINRDGYVEIVDRAKQLVKLSQGEYISITVLTDIYSMTPGIRNIYVYANSHHDAPLAVVIPDDQLVEKWKNAGITDFKGSKVAEDEVLKLLNETANNNKLRGFERIARVLLDDKEFTIDNGLLTPSMKLQWKSLAAKYEGALLELLK